jgi:hypothetical protein
MTEYTLPLLEDGRLDMHEITGQLIHGRVSSSLILKSVIAQAKAEERERVAKSISEFATNENEFFAKYIRNMDKPDGQ